MTLRFTVTQSVRATANFPFHPNSGPKRGVGSYATTKIGNGKGPIRGHGKPPEHKDPVYPPLKPSITVSRPKPHTHNVVPIQKKNADGSISFIGHEGPKRGFGLGPGVIYHRAIYKPHEGPKRGIGPPPIIISKEVGSKEDQLCLDLVNKFRRENGLWSLQFSKRLSEIAKPHTDDMLNGRKPLGHDGFNERSSQVPSALSTGENVGYEQGYPNPIQTLVDGWIKSPPHRKNLLGNFNQMGCAFSHRGDLWYGTQFFALI